MSCSSSYGFYCKMYIKNIKYRTRKVLVNCELYAGKLFITVVFLFYTRIPTNHYLLYQAPMASTISLSTSQSTHSSYPTTFHPLKSISTRTFHSIRIISFFPSYFIQSAEFPHPILAVIIKHTILTSNIPTHS